MAKSLSAPQKKAQNELGNYRVCPNSGNVKAWLQQVSTSYITKNSSATSFPDVDVDPQAPAPGNYKILGTRLEKTV
jgi:hypothetical protein